MELIYKAQPKQDSQIEWRQNVNGVLGSAKNLYISFTLLHRNSAMLL